MNEEWYREIVETAHEGVWVVDAEGKTVFVNRRMAEMLGCTVSEMMGKSMFDFMDESDHHKGKRIFESRSKQGVVGQVDYKFPKRDGSILWAIINACPYYNEQGEFAGVLSMLSDITDRKLAEKALRKANDELEMRVQQRTAELQTTVKLLENEIKERQRVGAELDNKAKILEEVNIALKVLVNRREQDKKELQENVIINMKDLVLPYLEKMKVTRLNQSQRAYLEVLETNLHEIVSPFARTMSMNYKILTPTEYQIANLIRQGKSTKEIALLLTLSEKTIGSHRKNIRTKLRIKGQKVNLSSYLMSLQAVEE